MHASGSLKEKYVHQANMCSVDFLLKALQICNKYDLSYKGSSNKQLHIEIALLDLSAITNEGGFSKESNFIRKPVEKKVENQPTVQKEKPVPSEKPKEYPKPIEKENISEPKSIPETKITPESDIKPSPKAEKPIVKSKAISKDAGKGRIIKNISIKQSLEALKNSNGDKSDEAEEVIINEFSQDKLSEIWRSFVVSYQEKSPSFANAIAKYDPLLKDNYVIEYKADSPIISKDLLSVTALLEFLKRELNNNQITLKSVVPSKTEQKRSYTDREKFDELSGKYPGIIKLKDQLNLEIEF